MSHRQDNTNNVPRNVVVTVANSPGAALFKVVSNSHLVEQSADNALWDTVSSTFVKPEDTNFHTGK